MVSPWKLWKLDENGNPVAADLDAATAADEQDAAQADRSPASSPSMPLMLSAKGRASYNPKANAVAMPVVKSPQKPNAMAMIEQAPQQPPLAPFTNPSSLQGLIQATGVRPGAIGAQIQDKNALTEAQKQSIQNTLFQNPVQAKLLMEMQTGHMPQPLLDETGMPVKDPDTGQTVYDPNNAPVDPEHPYQQSLAALQAQKDALAMRLKYAPNQVDLTPLMALADAWSPKGDKSNFAGSYKPHSYEQAADAALQQMQGISKDQIALAKEAATNANAMRAGNTNNMLSAQLLQSQMAGWGGRPFYGVPANVREFSLWQGSPEVKAYDSTQGEVSRLQQLRNEIASGNPVNDARLGVLRASIDAHGRPNMAEVQSEGGARDIVSRADQAYETAVSGKLTPENRQLVLDTIDGQLGYILALRSAYGKKAQGVARSYGVAPQDVASKITPTNTGMQGLVTPGMKPQSPGDAAAAQGPSIKDLLIEMRKGTK